MLISTEDLAAFAAEQREAIISKVPFRVRRAVRWSECDPAGVVYTGQFSEYLLSSVYLFRRHILDATWQDIKTSMRVDTPAKAISMIFNGSLWPDDVFDVHVRVGEIRMRSFDFKAVATRADNGSNVFEGTVAAICVSSDDRRRSVPIPEALRTRLELGRQVDGNISRDTL